MRCSILFTLTVLPACFAAPKADVPSQDQGSTGISLDDGDEEPYEPSGATEEDAGSDAPIATTSASDATNTDDASDTGLGETGVDPTVADDTGSGGAFPAPEPFGDDVRELDLVGSWTVPWDPTGVADVTIAITAEGEFTWRETEADCTVAGTASGRLWVEGTQLVMHLDAWDKTSPWNVEEEIGEPLGLPFRMRLGYVPMGGFLGISARPELIDVMPWRGVGYARLAAGSGPMGSWAAEAELWAIPDGATEPQLLVRDRFSAALLSGGTAMLDHSWTWWWPEQGAEQGDAIDDGWSDDTPGNVAGAATVAGDPFAYDALYLMAFAPDDTFKLGVASDCQ